jgi:hypothetical protein
MKCCPSKKSLQIQICQQSQSILKCKSDSQTMKTGQAVPKMVREQSDTKAKTAKQEKEKHENSRKARTAAASLNQKPRTLPLP